MLRVSFDPEAIDAIKYERLHHPHPRVQQKMWALWLKACELPHGEICRLVDISENTLRAYLREYLAGGVEGLKTVSFRKPQSELDKHAETIEAHFRREPPRTAAEAQAVIEKLTGIKRSPTQVRQFLHRIGMKFRKVAAIPAKANPEVQEAFRKRDLEPRLAQAKAGTRRVYFMDAAHFVQSAFLGFLWCFARLFVRSSSGRQRFNVLGALCATTHQLTTVCNTDYINSESVCELLRKLAALPGKTPITVVLDNARYQRCALVQATAQALGIELLFLPTYSPNLNLIERLWKFTKNKVLYSRYYATFGEFQDAIRSFLDNAHQTHREELDSLLTLRFQTFAGCA
jgi:transposase